MPSSKGKPTDPKLREKVKEEVKGETNKDGGGKGEWSAWKVCVQYGFMFLPRCRAFDLGSVGDFPSCAICLCAWF